MGRKKAVAPAAGSLSKAVTAVSTMTQDKGEVMADPGTAAPETIADTLAGAGDEPVTNLSTTVDITPCHGCDKHQVQFVTRDGVTTLRCKICDSEIEPADAGEAQSLRDYNRNVLTT